MKRSALAAFGLAVSCVALTGSAAITTSVDLSTLSSFATPATVTNSTSPVTPNFDYTTQGIPLAPGQVAGAASALRLQANVGSTATAGGVTLTPNGITLSGDYTISATVWMNTFGTFTGTASNGTATTQYFSLGGSYTSGVNYRASTTVGGGSGIWVAADNEGGFSATSTTIRDFNVFKGTGANSANFITTASVYQAGSQDNAASYHTTNFPLIDVTTVNGGTLASTQNTSVGASPQALAATNNGTGAGVAGALAFAWRNWQIQRTGGTIVWSIDGKTIATYDEGGVSTGGASLSYFDASSNISQYTGLNEALVSSFTVTNPEPATLTTLAAAGLIGFRRRRSN